MSIIAFCCSLPAQEPPPQTEEEFLSQYETRITKDRLGNSYIPKNMDETLETLDKIISPEAQDIIRNLPADSVCALLHPRLGQWMILNWGFYGGSRLSHYLKTAGVTYPDDQADLLILAYHQHLHQQPISMKALAAPFREKRRQAWEKEKSQRKIVKEITTKKQNHP
jgi:hypothetical protein